MWNLGSVRHHRFVQGRALLGVSSRLGLVSASIAVVFAGCEARPPRAATPVSPALPRPSPPPATPDSSAPVEPPAAAPKPDPWSGPGSWTTAPLACRPSGGGSPKSPSQSWTAMASGTHATLNAVTVSSGHPDEVWVVGDAGTILHTNDRGKTWTTCLLGSAETLTAVWAGEANVAWILGATHVLRVEWPSSVVTLATELEPYWDRGARAFIFGSGRDEIWISNQAFVGTRDHGASWSRLAPTPLEAHGCSDGADDVAASSTELWASCRFGVWRSRDGARTWEPTGWQLHTEERVYVAVGPDDAWAVGRDSLDAGRSTDHGASFTSEPLPSAIDRHAAWVWSGGAGWAWVMTDGVWVRRGRRGWVRDLPPNLEVRVGGSSAKNVWAVGAAGLLLHRR